MAVFGSIMAVKIDLLLILFYIYVFLKDIFLFGYVVLLRVTQLHSKPVYKSAVLFSLLPVQALLL